MYCLRKDGAIKRVGKVWAHVVCVDMIPGICFDSSGRKERIVETSKPSKSKFSCGCCGKPSGIVIKVVLRVNLV